jgi:hypothetical protein
MAEEQWWTNGVERQGASMQDVVPPVSKRVKDSVVRFSRVPRQTELPDLLVATIDKVINGFAEEIETALLAIVRLL